MTIKEAERRIKQAGGSPTVFWKWMEGQTMSLNDDGSTDVYEHDVERFIKYNCNPEKEPITDFD
jgi:hypothetical protein